MRAVEQVGARDVVVFVVALVACVLVVAGLVVALRASTRWYLVRHMTKDRPDLRAPLGALVRSGVPLTGRTGPASYPADPRALTTAVEVRPAGDGRPGERILLPGEPKHGPPARAGGSRQDLSLAVAPGRNLLVVCLGQVGVVQGARAVLPAPMRASQPRLGIYWTEAHPGAPRETAAGTAWARDP